VQGVQRLAGLLAPAQAAELLAALEPAYQAASAAAQAPGPAGSDGRFNRHSSSLNLGRAGAIDLTGWLQQAWTRPLREAALASLGARAWLAPDQCWLRRQFPLTGGPPNHAPPGHAPHGWHQDGALHCDFTQHPLPRPLRMLTCWMALTPCGRDAPSLQWVDADLTALLPPEALAPGAVSQRFAESRWQHATLHAGDALLFDGTVLHRTYLTPAMRAVRSSVEVRLFAASEAGGRLRVERLQPLGPLG